LTATLDRPRLTERQLNRATLARQLLLRREPLRVVDAVRRVVALQAQEAASPYLALWNRVSAFDPADLDAAFAAHQIVKASLVRLTLHAVHEDDHPVFHQAMVASLRGSRLTDDRFRQTGLTVAEADALVPDVLEFTREARTNDQVQTFLDERIGVRPKPGAWWALRTFAPLVHAPTGGPWTFGQRPSYLTARTGTGRGDPADAVPWLLRRYLEGFGPASAKDFGQFSIIRQPAIRAAIEALGDELVELEGPDGSKLYDVPGGAIPGDDTPAPPRLMAMWDSILLAYADRSRTMPPEYRRLVIRQNGDTLPTLLVDGLVAGVWRPVEGGIEATAFHELDDATWTGLAAEASALVAFLADRDPTVYRRYAHWWRTLPHAEVRILPATR
jgi:hypothetical protein